MTCDRAVRMRQGLSESWRPFALPSAGGRTRRHWPSRPLRAIPGMAMPGKFLRPVDSSRTISQAALRAWNQVGKPRIDSVRIEGLERTRHALVTEALDLRSSALLTEQSFLRAERRLAQLPDRASARMSFAPQSDGFASVDVAVAERRSRPRGQ